MSDQQDRPKCPNTPKYPCGDCPACQVPLAAPAGLHSWPPGFHEAWPTREAIAAHQGGVGRWLVTDPYGVKTLGVFDGDTFHVLMRWHVVGLLASEPTQPWKFEPYWKDTFTDEINRQREKRDVEHEVAAMGLHETTLGGLHCVDEVESIHPADWRELLRQRHERAPAPPAAPEPATRPQAPAQPQDPAARPGIAPGRQLDSAGFGPWPSEEEIEAHGNGLWLIRQKGEMAPGQIRGMALGRFGKEEGRTVWWSGGRFSDQKYMSPWTFCPIDENGDKLGAAPVLRGKDATSLLESLANTAPPEGIARRREESRRRSSEGYYLEPKADPTVARILASLPPRQPERRVLVVLRGLPGSGKSTVAQAIVDSDPARWVRVSKDDLRQMMVGQGRNLFQFVEDKAREGLIAEAIKHVAGIALQGDLDVVVDATNLTSGNLDDWFEDVASWCAMWKEAPVLVCERAIDVSVEECVARDDRRPGYRRVGRAVIERLAATIDLELADRDHEVG